MVRPKLRLIRSAAVALGLGFTMFFQNCGELKSAHVSNASSESSLSTIDGKSLYTTNCAACHGSVENSQKRNRSIAQIATAIGSVPQMLNLAFLTPAERQAIENALSDTAQLNCAPNANILKPQIKRLTSNQFKNSVRNAFGNIFNESQFPNFGDGNTRIGLANDPAGLSINEINFASLHTSVTLLVATAVTQNTTVSTCIAATTDTCFANVLSSFGRRLWRRPLTALETSEINTGLVQVTTAGGNRTDRISLLLKALLLSPAHLYRTEIGGGMVPGSRAILQLGQYEIASFLAFAAWDFPPDDTLLALAAQNQLANVSVLQAQVQRMITDPRFKKSISGYLVDVLKIEDVKTISKDASYGLTATERLALQESAVATIESSLPAVTTDFMAPFTTTQFQVNTNSARFFNQAPASFGVGFTAYNANSSQRLGLLSHPAFLTSIAGNIDSGIVKRGVFTIEQVLCNTMPAAPPDISSLNPLIPPGFDPATSSTRQILEVTHSNRASCVSCHTMINPAGFGYENFNSIGLYRTTEKTNIPIDASGSVSGIAEKTLTFTDSVSYIRALTSSTAMRRCMTKHYFKYVAGQSSESSAGHCEFNNFESKVQSKGPSTRSLLESAVELDSFIRRKPDGT